MESQTLKMIQNFEYGITENFTLSEKKEKTTLLHYHCIKGGIEIINCKTYIWISRNCFYLLETYLAQSQTGAEDTIALHNEIGSW